MLTPIVIGHRGASGYLPEHTLAAYFLALQHGVDFIEPDLVMSEATACWWRATRTRSAARPMSPLILSTQRAAQRLIDGMQVEGWFTEDFTLAELKSLRARERIPQLRAGNARFDGLFEIPTLEEILVLVQGVEATRAQRAAQLGLGMQPRIGVYPETKHPSYFAARGLAMEAPLVATLERFGYRGRAAPVWLQSFEVGNLIALSRMSELGRVQLIEDSGAPYDFLLAARSAQLRGPADTGRSCRHRRLRARHRTVQKPDHPAAPR